MLTAVSRTDAGIEIPATRAEMLAELATLEPKFSAAGRSDEYVRARLDHAREKGTGRRADAIDPDEAMRRSRERAANAWRTDARGPSASAERKENGETDPDDEIDPDEKRAEMRKRNADAWKGKSSVDLLTALEGKDPSADKDGIGPFGMRHGKGS